MLALLGVWTGCGRDQKKLAGTDEFLQENLQLPDEKVEEERKQETIQVRIEDFERISATEVRICWSDGLNPKVKEYQLERLDADQWVTIGTLTSDQQVLGRTLALVDTLESDKMQQHQYRIKVKPLDSEVIGIPGKAFPASNILLCLDPGHYSGVNQCGEEDGIIYSEGDFTMELASCLQEILKEEYGVTCMLTRESGSIHLNGYQDAALDQGHISLRGSSAIGSNLFLSLHTNANLDGANGYDTIHQPLSINKPIILVNTVARDTAFALDIANGIGRNLASTSFRLGIATVGEFQEVEKKQEILPWTDAINDRLNVPGSVYCRDGDNGDYYGVLRGAANVGVPGIIVEHGFHTVQQIRKMAAEGDLKEQWARADAYGIAEGLGLLKKEE